jgi:predicted nucleotidyltransferase
MIENIFTSKVASKIILYVGRRPYREFYLNEISKDLRIGLGRTKTILEYMNKLKILTKRKSGNRILYKLNENNELSMKIIELANLNTLMELPDNYRTAINRFSNEYENVLGENLTSIVIFGSVAKGSATKWSDIDLLVVIKEKPNKEIEDKLRDIFSQIMEIFSKISQEHIYTQLEFQESYNIGDDFLINVMKDGIIVYDKKFFGKFLIRGVPAVTKKAIERRLKIAKDGLDSAIEVYDKFPSSVSSQLGMISMHLSRSVLLLNDVIPGSKHEIPKQIFKKTREWWELTPINVDKDEVYEILTFLKEKYIEYSRKLERWS